MNKQGVFLYMAIALASCLLLSFNTDNIEKRIVRNQDFDHHFFIYTKTKKAQKDKVYFWFRSGEIHQSRGAIAGSVLHDTYQKFYPSKQLAQQGQFYYGLKHGIWLDFFTNGEYAQKIHWQNGVKHGNYYQFDPNGTLITKGRFRKGIKHGLWINFKTGDTLWYKKGIAYPQHPRVLKKYEDSLAGKRSFFKRLLSSKPNDSLTHKDTLKKPNLLRRIFSKTKPKSND